MDKKLNDKLVESYLDMIKNDVVRAEDDNIWTAEELAGYFLYNYNNKNDTVYIALKNVKNDTHIRAQAWKLIKKVFYPKTYLLRIA